MPILGNSVWSVKDVPGLADGLYRVLDIIPQTNEVVLFPIVNDRTEVKPICFLLDLFQQAVADTSIIKSNFELPSYMQKSGAEISVAELKVKEKNWSLIEELIKDASFVYDYTTNSKSSKLTKHAAKVGTYRKKLARLLTLYWKLGQSSNALLPSYQNSGGGSTPFSRTV